MNENFNISYRNIHCHINPPNPVVNDFDDTGDVEVPGDDSPEDLLANGLDDVNLRIQ